MAEVGHYAHAGAGGGKAEGRGSRTRSIAQTARCQGPLGYVQSRLHPHPTTSRSQFCRPQRVQRQALTVHRRPSRPVQKACPGTTGCDELSPPSTGSATPFTCAVSTASSATLWCAGFGRAIGTYVRRLVRGEEEDGGGDLLGDAEPAGRVELADLAERAALLGPLERVRRCATGRAGRSVNCCGWQAQSGRGGSGEVGLTHASLDQAGADGVLAKRRVAGGARSAGGTGGQGGGRTRPAYDADVGAGEGLAGGLGHVDHSEKKRVGQPR